MSAGARLALEQIHFIDSQLRRLRESEEPLVRRAFPNGLPANVETITAPTNPVTDQEKALAELLPIQKYIRQLERERGILIELVTGRIPEVSAPELLRIPISVSITINPATEKKDYNGNSGLTRYEFVEGASRVFQSFFNEFSPGKFILRTTLIPSSSNIYPALEIIRNDRAVTVILSGTEKNESRLKASKTYYSAAIGGIMASVPFGGKLELEKSVFVFYYQPSALSPQPIVKGARLSGSLESGVQSSEPKAVVSQLPAPITENRALSAVSRESDLRLLEESAQIERPFRILAPEQIARVSRQEAVLVAPEGPVSKSALNQETDIIQSILRNK